MGSDPQECQDCNAAMAERWNIFLIARRGSANDEDQLTELLAYLLDADPTLRTDLLADLGCKAADSSLATQRRIADGRLDLEISADGAQVVIESKLRSRTTFAQCKTYIEHLARTKVPDRVLVLVTKDHEDWPAGIVELAVARNVRLVARRWWDVTILLDQASNALPSDFAEMLRKEGLVVPDPLTENDWINTDRLPPAAPALLNETRSALRELSPEPRTQAIYNGLPLYRSIYCSARSKRAEIAVGLAATWDDLAKHRRVEPKSLPRPIDGSVISSWVRDRTLSEQELRVPAEEAVAVGGPDVVGVSWRQCPARSAPAASVLTAPDFQGQVLQAVEYARATAEHFRRVGYLKDAPSTSHSASSKPRDPTRL
jgi:hypothetical protein